MIFAELYILLILLGIFLDCIAIRDSSTLRLLQLIIYLIDSIFVVLLTVVLM